jgi:hypothetical protein
MVNIYHDSIIQRDAKNKDYSAMISILVHSYMSPKTFQVIEVRLKSKSKLL